MKKVTIMQAVLDAIDETNGSISKHMNQLIKWAKYCEKSIGSLQGYPVKVTLFTVNDSSVVLPDDCYRVLYVINGDYTDQANLRYKDLEGITVHIENITIDPSVEYVWQNMNAPLISNALWEEVGNILSIIDLTDGSAVTLVYQYIETDMKGYWIVNENHIDAIKKYLIYMISKKFMFKNFMSSKLTRNSDLAMLQDYKRDYNIAIRNARAEDNKETPVERVILRNGNQ